jgi:hypothetical protein
LAVLQSQFFAHADFTPQCDFRHQLEFIARSDFTPRLECINKT